jgi:hypothetical protein
MFILLALPVIAVVASAHRYLQVYAPSNVLARRVRVRRTSWRIAAGLLGVAGLLLAAMHAVAAASTARGAPGWLNLVVLVLAWDAIKVGMLSVAIGVRCAVRALGQLRSAATP